MGKGWIDYTWYVDYFNSNTLSLIEQRDWTSITQFLSGEVLWDLFVLRATEITGDAAIALRIISFFICLIWGLFLFRKMPIYWALTFLLNPISITMAMDVIRNGFAWSLIILSLMLTQKWLQPLKFLICVATPFIHTNSAALLLLVFNPAIRLFQADKKFKVILSSILPGVAVGLLVTVFGSSVLSSIGDRRAGEIADTRSGSYTEIIFWVILFIIQLSCSTSYIKNNSLTINILAWYFIMNLSIPWSYRLWSAAIPLMACAIWEMPKEKRDLVLLFWLGYFFLLYIYWTPMFNWLDLGTPD
ncbi:MAG: hypothetical protein RMY34_17950 [Aulosira sp. DedQUE10]|nr:hypothetical protein [Aulosira sp. DedQUE10]